MLAGFFICYFAVGLLIAGAGLRLLYRGADSGLWPIEPGYWSALFVTTLLVWPWVLVESMIVELR